MADGSSVNVLFELDLDGEEAIWTQLLKLSEDILKVPEHVVFEVLIVTVDVSIASENVTEMLLLIDTPVWLSVGEIEETAGPVVSISNDRIFKVTALHRLSVIVIYNPSKFHHLKNSKW